jgi:hypothetical protein
MRVLVRASDEAREPRDGDLGTDIAAFDGRIRAMARVLLPCGIAPRAAQVGGLCVRYHELARVVGNAGWRKWTD